VSPTFNSWVKLKVIVPPKPPVIENERGKVLSAAAAAGGAPPVIAETDPVAEGGSLRLHCLTAGDPVPTVSWRYRGVPLPPVSLHSDANTGQVRSTVTLNDIRRHVVAVGSGDGNNDHAAGVAAQHQLVECSAHNNDLTPPATAAVRLRIISPPLRVKIVREAASFTAGTAVNLTCQVLGSSPAPQVSFLIGGGGGGKRPGGRLLPLSFSQESPDGSVFSAVAQYEPLAADNGEFLACRAANRLLPDTTLEDQWKLDVQCEYCLFFYGYTSTYCT
jgi:hypothetical protein